MRNGSKMVDAALVTHSMEYVSFLRSFDSLQTLTNFE